MRMNFTGFAVALALFWGATASAANETSYLDVDLLQNRYLGEASSSSQNPNYTLISGDLNAEAHTKGFNFKFNPVVQGAMEVKNEFYFGVPEMYVQPRGLAPGFSLTIGRQKRNWSYLDEEFNLGVWQPQLRWDYLAPKQQGLTGVFFDWSLSSNLHFSFFTSPLFLPDQGPNYALDNGRFTSSNRWFSPPQSRVALFDGTPYAKDTPLYYKIDRPSEEDILMHSSFGFGVRYEGPGPFWTQVNYAYKPRNQIHLGIECEKCAILSGSSAGASGAAPVEINAVIHPTIIKHHVITWETGLDRIDDRGWISLTGDFPNSSGFPANYEESPLNSAMIAGATYQHYVFSWFGKPSWLKYSYMQMFDLQNKDKKGLVDSDQVQSSLDRYAFKQIAAMEWTLFFTQSRASRLQLKNRYSYSIPERGGWLTSSLDYSEGALTYSVGLDVLGSDVDPNSTDAGTFTKYRSNDRVFGGVSYVF